MRQTVFLCLFLFGCASVQVPDFKAYVTLPASGDGFYVKTVSDEEGVVPKSTWDELRRRGITILSEDWAILRFVILKNCATVQCKDVVGTFDDIFDKLNEAAKKKNKK